MEKDYKTKLKEILENKGVKIPQLSRETGIPKDRIYAWYRDDTNPKSEDQVILDRWINGDNFNFIERRRQQKIKNEPYLVPFMPVKAQAGYTKAIDQATFIDELERYALPPGVDPLGAVWRYWEIEGNSMEPTFRSGDVILTSQIHYMDWDNLRNFYRYVIVTNEKVLFKIVYVKNELEWVLISENEEYPQQLLPVEYIKEVWVYRRSIVTKPPHIKMYEIKV